MEHVDEGRAAASNSTQSENSVRRLARKSSGAFGLQPSSCSTSNEITEAKLHGATRSLLADLAKVVLMKVCPDLLSRAPPHRRPETLKPKIPRPAFQRPRLGWSLLRAKPIPLGMRCRVPHPLPCEVVGFVTLPWCSSRQEI